LLRNLRTMNIEDESVVVADAPDVVNTCKNCESQFHGKFCHACGQSVKDFDRPLKFLFLDFTGNVFAFDTRLWRTIKNVFFRPGLMEREYTEGKRIKYMPPFRLYVFISFIFFLLITWMSEKSIREGKSGLINVNVADSLQRQSDGDERERFRALLAERFNQEEVDSLLSAMAGQELEFATKPKTFIIDNPVFKADLQDVIDNPATYSNRFIKYFSWSLFLLMPFYGFLLWVFFRKSRPLYVTHLNLAINQHVFVFLILMIMSVIELIFPDKQSDPESFLAFLIPVYAVIGSKRLFQFRWRSVIWRLMVVQFLYLIVILTAVVMLVLLTFF
jgi:hypothetical protein